MKHKIIGLLVLAICFSTAITAQKSYWSQVDSNRSAVSFDELKPNSYQINTLDFEAFRDEALKAFPREFARRASDVMLSFPNVEGDLEQFRIEEVAIFSEEVAAEFPKIKAYVGYGVDTPGARVRFTVSPQGVQSMLTYPDQPRIFTVPTSKGNNTEYITYQNASRKEIKKRFECLTEEVAMMGIPSTFQTRDADDQLLRTFRIAISASGDYTQFWDDGDNSNGDARMDAMAQIASTLNRNNEIYEVDMAINFQLVTGSSLIYTNPNSDPYTSFGSLSSQLQNTLTSNIGEPNYDIGHLFHFGTNSSNLGNGSAGCIGCVCVDGQKGRGFSSHIFEGQNGSPYMSDYFDVDYVAHEIGHQMGANHTWAFSTEGTGVNVEPGSGTTIMAYAGITGVNDVQDHSDPYFHYNSILQILNTVAVRTCWTSVPITNNPPAANAGDNYTIPQGTAFVLRGSATDPDGADQLTYTWEQIDNGVSSFSNFGPTRTSGGMFRSRPPSTSPDRYMPTLPRILEGRLTETGPVQNAENTSWETVATVSRTMNFALTVRDRSIANGVGQFPQSSFDVMTVTVEDGTGPFEVTSQTTNELWEEDESQTITWDVAGTDFVPIGTTEVNILLSIDGGFTYPFTLASATANDGTETITVPDIGVNSTTEARIMVEANDNIFLAVNSTNFTIQEPAASVDDESLAGFNLFPNPSTGNFRLQFNTAASDLVELQVYDLSGRSVYAKNYRDVSGFFDQEVSLGNMAKGIYLLRVVNGGKLTTRKLVVE
jgi:hypothetical protein